MLILHQSNRLEHLAQGLAELLALPTDAPLQPDWIVVQHPGMARWLSLQLAASLGIAANLEFPLPAVFIWQALRHLLGDVPELDRYQPQRLAWRIHEQLSRREPSAQPPPLSAYLETGDELRRYQLAQELALLFDRYLLYRPDWIAAWERGESAVEGDAWQADLWRGLAQDEACHWVSLQQRLFAQPLSDGAASLPQRICLFALPTLSPGYLQILQRLAEVLDLHLFLLNPCAAHWADIVAPKRQVRSELQGEAAALYLEVGHPLLASLGRQGRDFFAAINELDPGSEERFEPAAGGALLPRVQNQILDLETLDAVQSDDDSIALHLCHSPMREVEVLYDQLLAMLETMPDLAPNEILVMTPEIDRYAPLIEAVFGEPGDRPPIPFRISDRNLLQPNSLAGSLLELLDLPASRYTIGQLLSLLEQPAIQRRFGLHESALESITQWLIDAGIRWGRDGESKSAFGLPPEDGNTWRAGLQRLLLGYAMPGSKQDLWRGVLPLDAAEGSATEQLDGLFAFCDQLFSLESRLTFSRSVAGWRDCLLQLVQEFYLPDETSQQQADEVCGMIQRLAEEAEEAGFQGEVSLGLIRYRLQALFESADSRGFLGGGVTCCALAPMRSLPFRVICLLGMNEESFPRRQPRLGFDLMAGQFRFGDRSRRVDDRYLFLETLISARERLYISYVGRSQRDNSPLPPAVVVDELCDTLRLMLGDEGLAQIRRRHPLQPFSRAYFEERPGLFTYSAARREAAMRIGQGTGWEGPLAPQTLPHPDAISSEEVSLDRLIAFFANPPRAFAQQRLQLNLDALTELPEEREPFALDKYQRLDQERELVEELLDAVPPEILLEKLRAAGSLPQGRAGQLEFEGMLARADAMAVRLRPMLEGSEPRSWDLNLPLSRGSINGRLHNLLATGNLAYTTDSFHPYQLLQYWIEHLALNLARLPGIAPETHLLEAERRGLYHPPADAEAQLASLMDLYRAGHERPLPFYPATAWAYLEGLAKGGEEQALKQAQSKWYGNRKMGGDAHKPYNQLMWPDGDCFSPEFGHLAETVLRPLWDHLEWR